MESDWISVRKMLPELGADVVTKLKNGEVINNRLSFRIANIESGHYNQEFYRHKEVTHWMPTAWLTENL